MNATAPFYTPATVIYLQPGDRVRCHDTFNGTVVRVVDRNCVVVDSDDVQGRVRVYAPFIGTIPAA